MSTGNVVQLLMRAVQKLEYIEQRNCANMAQARHFWLDIHAEFLDVIWRDHASGRDNLTQQKTGVSDFHKEGG